MGNTTIIELNHDRWNEISENKEEFILQILNQIHCMNLTGKDIHGGKVIAGFHRSGKVYAKWTKFKKGLNDGNE